MEVADAEFSLCFLGIGHGLVIENGGNLLPGRIPAVSSIILLLIHIGQIPV